MSDAGATPEEVSREKTESCWERTEGCCLVEAARLPRPKRRRAANGQRVTSNTRNTEYWWDCDHAHDTIPAKTHGNELTQDRAYAALDAHNAAHHPHLTRGS